MSDPNPLAALVQEAEDDGAYDPPGCEHLRAFINAQAAEIERLRARCAELEAAALA